MKPVYVGCSGWSYKHWRGRLYAKDLPARRWLERYAEEFATVEVNATFYRLPTRKAVETWAEQTPKGFTFALKVSRYLTHVKRLTGVETGIKRFLEPLEPLLEAGKVGPFLWQFPETFHRDDARLRDALEGLPDGRHCFEFRHPSWFADEVYALLAARNAALVIGHDSRREPFPTEMTADWTFVRFHHGSGRSGRYSEAELERWKRRIAAWRSRVEVFAYFNNDRQGIAVDNGRWLRDRLG